MKKNEMIQEIYNRLLTDGGAVTINLRNGRLELYRNVEPGVEYTVGIKTVLETEWSITERQFYFHDIMVEEFRRYIARTANRADLVIALHHWDNQPLPNQAA